MKKIYISLLRTHILSLNDTNKKIFWFLILFKSPQKNSHACNHVIHTQQCVHMCVCFLYVYTFFIKKSKLQYAPGSLVFFNGTHSRSRKYDLLPQVIFTVPGVHHINVIFASYIFFLLQFGIAHGGHKVNVFMEHQSIMRRLMIFSRDLENI